MRRERCSNRRSQIDPNDADALAGDAYTYMLDYAYGWTTPRPITMQKCSVRPTGPSRSLPITSGRIM